MAEENRTMELHEIQAKGTFGGIVGQLNDNFARIIEAILKKRDGKSAYELWVEQPGNEGKSIDAFWAYLTADKGYTKQVLTYAEFSALNPQTADTDTIYIYPNADNTEYYNVISNGTSWVNLITKDGEIADYAKIKAALLKSSSSRAERYANLEIGGINGNLNSNIASTGAIRSINSFLITDSNVRVVVHSKSGNYFPKVAAYNGCDAVGNPAAIKSNSDTKYSVGVSITDANVGSYLRFIIYVYEDSSQDTDTKIDTITQDILDDIYVSSEDSTGVQFDASNSNSSEISDDEFYNVADIAEEVALNKSKIERIESGENDKIPSSETEELIVVSSVGGYFDSSGNVVNNQQGFNRGVSGYIDVTEYANIKIVSGIGGSGAYKVGAVLYDDDDHAHIMDDGIIVGTSSDGTLSAGTIIDTTKAKFVRLGLSDASIDGVVIATLSTNIKKIVEELSSANIIQRIEGIEESVPDIESDTPYRTDIATKNEGYLNSNGSVHVNTTGRRGVSDYIVINGVWKIVTITGVWAAGGNNKPFMCFYDANKNAILPTPDACTATGAADGKTITSDNFPESAAYIRISMADYDVPGVVELYKMVTVGEKVKELSERTPDADKKILVVGSSSIQRMEKNVGSEYSLSALLDVSSERIVMSGVGGEDIKAITARLGSEMLTNRDAFRLPATTDPVTLGLVSEGVLSVRGVAVDFKRQNGAELPKLNPVYVDGIECRVGKTSDTNGSYTIARVEAGAIHDVPADTPIFPYNIYKRDHILVTALGYNGGYNGLDEYIAYHERARMFCESGKFIFIGRLYGNGWGAESDMLEEESAMRLRYGYNYFNIRRFLVERGVEYARRLSLYDETYAEQDAADMSSGLMPTSLRGDGVHISNNGYKIVNFRLSEIIKYFKWV